MYNYFMIEKLFSNIYISLILVCGVLIISALYNRKQNSYYNHGPKMENHILNTKYEFDKKRKIKLDVVNSIISKFYIGVAVITFMTGTLLSLLGCNYNFSLTSAAIVYLVLTIVAHFVSGEYVGRKFKDFK